MINIINILLTILWVIPLCLAGINVKADTDTVDPSILLATTTPKAVTTTGSNSNSNSSSGKNLVDLRLDLIQPELWVMNGDSFFGCDFLDAWWSSDEAKYHTTSVYPAQVTTQPEYEASVCGQGGLYFSTDAYPSGTSSLPTPTATVPGVINGDPYVLPYMNVIDASGVFETNNIYFNTTTNKQVVLSNFTFLNVNNTNMYFGGLGLAGPPSGSGFLDSLTSLGIIKSPSYSLWFNNYSDISNALGELIPGIIDKKYYSGNLYSYDIPPHSGIRFPNDNNLDEYSNNALKDLVLPILQLDDLRVQNQINGQSISLQSSSDESFALLLDSRSSYNYIPLDMIVNLAIQTNAYYSNEAERWLVECDVITDSKATLNFVFGALEIQIPLQDFVVDAIYIGKNLKFSNGEKACYLTFLPASLKGYNSLGLPFITNIYLAVDNAGKSIALANSNRNLKVNKQAIIPTGEVDPFSFVTSSSSAAATSTASGSLASSNQSTSYILIDSSIGYIQSGKIPFATPNTVSQDAVLSYSTIDGAEASGAGANLDIPARFSGAVIKSGEIIITGVTAFPMSTSTVLPGVASAASERATTTRKSEANSKFINFLSTSSDKFKIKIVNIFVILFGFMVTICLLL
ncbi:aspartic peptidase domain-containing protein [Scheffersomyces amazonensis]|uniref:aspartic peptidase domain-containing protein n=1 Tax=Scheffersomyces amazonensis TaxID=1078765 RepID=UPI00315DDE36